MDRFETVRRRSSAVPTLSPFLALILLFLAFAVAAMQADRIPRGALVEKVECSASPGQSYALYLPSAYDPQLSWPVLYCFDPGARGAIPVELFAATAEKLGVILVGSNNSQNGVPFAPACRAVWFDSHARFRLNDRAVFCAGFSGGAHVAFSFFQVAPAQVSGVIACCNGLPPWMKPADLPPSTAVWLLTGREDFNHRLTKKVAPELAGRGIWSHAEVFPGAHEWPPAAYAAAALEALVLRSMQTGAISKSETLEDDILSEQRSQALTAVSSGDEVFAHLVWLRLIRMFDGLRPTSDFSAGAEALKNSPRVAAHLAEIDKADRREGELRDKVQPAYLGLFDPGLTTAEIGQGLRQLGIDRLRDASESGRPSPERTASIRIISDLYLTAYMDGSQYREKKDWQNAETAFEVMRRIKPNRWQPLFNLATVAAGRGEKKTMLKLLRSALEKGLADPLLLESAPFQPFLQDVDFLELKNQIKPRDPEFEK